MRRIFFFVLALSVMLTICMGLLLIRPSFWPEAAARLGALPPSEGSSSTDRASPFAVSAAKEAVPRPTVTPVNRIEQAPPEPLRNNTAAEPVKYPFPVGTDVAVGVSKADILAKFGPPDATITGADSGRLHERLIYRDPSGGKKTIITVVNAVATTAETFLNEGTRD